MIRQIRTNKRKQFGVTLLEVLISIVILAIGLLGFSSLMTTSMKSNRTALYRSFATMYAYDILDCMRANRAAAVAGSYDIAFTASPPSSPSTIAGKDLKQWLEELADALPDGDGTIDVTGGVATVQIRWTEGTESDGTTPKTTTFQTSSSLRS